jgi:NitT/TauT family transport system ATP-binding protein
VNGRDPRAARGWAGYMTQADALLPWRTVLGNAEIGLELRGVPPAERRASVRSMLVRVGLSEFESKYPFELSGGMRKRLSLVRVLAYSPDVLFLDEPFAALDAQTRETLQQDLLDLWEATGKTVVFVTHDLTEALSLSQRVVVLSGRPGTIKREYRVALPRLRPLIELRLLREFTDLFRQVWSDLRPAEVSAATLAGEYR